MISLFDTHFHLDEEDNLGDVIREAKEFSVNFFNLISCNYQETKRNLSLVSHYDNVYTTTGIHPCYIKNQDEYEIEKFIPFLAEKKILAIGEIGLDYYHNQDNKQLQKKVFEQFLNLCYEYDKTAIIHTRDSIDDCYDMLKSLLKKEKKFIIHCFTGDKAWAKKILDIGGYIAYGGIVTFKNSLALQESVSVVPLDRILIETDAPYLAPMPYRGKKNKPAYAYYVFEQIHNLIHNSQQITKQDLAEKILHNSRIALGLL